MSPKLEDLYIFVCYYLIRKVLKTVSQQKLTIELKNMSPQIKLWAKYV